MKKAVLILLALALPQNTIAWSGYHYNSGSYIEIEGGNLVRPGEEIEYYDYGNGEYKVGEVESMDGQGVEVYDHESGDYRTFEMDQ